MPEPVQPQVRLTGVSGFTFLRLVSWSQRPVGTLPSTSARLLRLAPDECLIVSGEPDASKLQAAVLAGLPEEGRVLVDVTDGISAFELRGAAVRDVLSRCCGLDLHPRSFPPGRCARTRFAQIAVVIDCLEESTFALYVAQSYSRYLRSWLIDAGATADPGP